MFVSQFIPRALAACFVLAILTLNVAAQTQSIHPRPTTQSTTSDGDAQLENDVFLVSEAEPVLTQLTKPALLAPSPLRFNQMMMTAMIRDSARPTFTARPGRASSIAQASCGASSTPPAFPSSVPARAPSGSAFRRCWRTRNIVSGRWSSSIT